MQTVSQQCLSGALAAPRRYQPYGLHNLQALPQRDRLTAEQRFAIEVVGRVLPFRTNNYVVEELIDWTNIPDDPIFNLTFPRQAMLAPQHFAAMADALRSAAPNDDVQALANRIRYELNPHPAGQLTHNVPLVNGQRLHGLQHKYRETVLFFPGEGQTCHAFCSFCFRWPQFVGLDGMKFASREAGLLVEYIRRHSDVSDILLTGGDPLIMRTRNFANYIDRLLEADLPNLHTIRIGTKTLGYWPYRFLSDHDADDLLRLFERIVKSGRHLAIMSHFSHPVELSTPAVQQAIRRIRETGAQIRTQSPLLRHINADPAIWAEMWREQVQQGLVPYYMFVVRDTGARHFFEVPLVEAWQIFRQAYCSVSGISRTVRGPSMSAHPGKIQILGVSEVNGEQVFVLRFLQARNPEWVGQPFFARFDEQAFWLDDLKPAFGAGQFFYEEELAALA
jgi:KamA family protein